MKLLLKIISPIIASVLGVLLTNSFNLFDQVGKKLSEKIDEKTQAIKNKKQTITE